MVHSIEHHFVIKYRLVHRHDTIASLTLSLRKLNFFLVPIRLQPIMGGVYSQTFGDTTDYYESPPYSVVEEKDGYELRKYEASMWTSAKMDHRDDMTDEKMNSSMFWSLFNYISGKTNDEKQKVSMTAPVLVQSKPNIGMKMSFFLPKDNQEKPPQPSEGHVATDPWPVSEFYVRRFSPTNSKIEHFLTEKKEMANAMTRDGIELKENFEWMRAGYDPPFKITNRRSEVWIPVDQVVGGAKSAAAEVPALETSAAAEVPVAAETAPVVATVGGTS